MIQFGLSRLRAYTNGVDNGCTVGTGGVDATATVDSGYVWIGGVYAKVSGGHDLDISAISIDSGLKYIFARLAAGQSSTATLDVTSVDPRLWGYPVIAKVDFDSGANNLSGIDTSGTTGCRAFGRAMSCNVNISYDSAFARGGTLIFANDSKLFNGAVEGDLEYATISGANLAAIYGGKWTSGAAGSGTWSLSATNAPLPFMIETQQITNGVTATIRILKCHSNQISMSMNREEYTIPKLSFQAIANKDGDVLTIQG